MKLMPAEHVKKGVMRVKHHVLPHPRNKTRATLLRKRAILIYSLSILTFFTVIREVPRAVPGILSYASNIEVSDLLRYTNKKRADAGVGALTINPKLTQAAQKKAEHMFKNNYWAHVAPDGTDPWSFIISTDYDYQYAGENLAKNFNNSKDVVDAWYKSHSHKENLLSEKYSEVGFASVNGVLDGYETTLVVQMFGKTRSAPAQVAVKGDQNNSAVRQAAEPLPVPEVVEVQNAPVLEKEELFVPNRIPKIDVYRVTRMVIVVFATFMFVLFALDMWYSKRHAIFKCTGHTFAHMAFLIFAVTVVYFSLQPGRLI